MRCPSCKGYFKHGRGAPRRKRIMECPYCHYQAEGVKFHNDGRIAKAD